jgi:multimeric flavodoxin WrbA
MKASPVNVLVIFYSCCGRTEKLALAAAVGAVQARANIRMRRLADSGEQIPECKEALARMRKEYVPPAQTDVVWADAVIIGINGKVAGVVEDAAQATAFGRRIVGETRAVKEGQR